MENKYRRAYRSEEFQEEDIWEVIKQEDDTGFKKNDHLSSPHTISKRVPSAARMIPGLRKHQQIDENVHIVQSSAPVNIPDWSKIYGSTSRSCSSSSLDHDHHDDGDDDDDDKDGKLPPHEWLAKKFAKNQISSFSVCEGVGRTLKGRDLSRGSFPFRVIIDHFPLVLSKRNTSMNYLSHLLYPDPAFERDIEYDDDDEEHQV